MGFRLVQVLNPLIFYSLLCLIALVAVPYGTVDPLWEAVFECTIFALGAVWVVEGMLSEGWLSGGHRIFLPVFILILYAFIQTLTVLPGNYTGVGLKVWNAISADPYETRLFVLKLLALAMAGVLLLRYTNSRWRRRSLVFTLIAVGLASALFGILRQGVQHEQGFLLQRLEPDSGYAQFINRNHFAYLMEMVLGLISGLIVGSGARKERALVYLALLLPVWTALVLCNSRGGLFSMLAQTLFLALFFGLTRRPDGVEMDNVGRSRLWRLSRSAIFRPVIILALILVVFAGAAWLSGERLAARLETVSRELNAEGSEGNEGVRRLEIWRATWQMIKDHPLAGVGFSGYSAAIPRYHNASGSLMLDAAHNDYLEALASGGLIGALLVACFILLLIRSACQGFKSTDSFSRAACFGACAGLFGVAVHSLFDFGLQITINALVFTALVVIVVSAAGPEEHLETVS